MRAFAAAAISVAFLFLVACHDSTGPAPVPFSISISVESVTGPTFIDSDTLTQIQCDVSLKAVAAGSGGASWAGAILYFYAGPNRAAPIDSTTLSEGLVRRSWGGTAIDASQEQHAQWRLTTGIPFGAGFVYGYYKDGEEKRTDPVTFTCGPTIPPGTPPPVVNAPSVTPAGGNIEGGDTIHVTFGATSAVGMWESDIELTGACHLSRQIPEHLSTTVSHSVTFVVPPNCQLGGSLTVKLRVFDASARGIETQLGTFTIVDQTPPHVVATFGFNYDTVLSGFYFGGDSIPAYLGASDNQALSVVSRVVGPWGLRDSVRTSAASIYGRLDIPIPEAWTGKIQMRAFSRDAAGLASDTIVTPPDSLLIYPTVTHPVQSRTMGGAIRDVIFDDGRNVIYVLAWAPDYLAVLSQADLTVIDSIPLPGAASDFDITPSGDTLVLALGGLRALGIVDLTAPQRAVVVHPLTTLNAAMEQRPEVLRIPASGKVFVRLNGATYLQTTLLEVDLSTGTERVRTDAGDNGLVGYVTMARSNDHRVIVLRQGNQLQKYDASPDVFGSMTSAVSYATHVSLDATGSHLALGLDVYDAVTLQFERRVDSPAWDPDLPLALSPDGRFLYHYVLPRGVLRSDATSGKLIDRTRTSTVAALRVSPSGTRLAMVSWRTLALMDLR